MITNYSRHWLKSCLLLIFISGIVKAQAPTHQTNLQNISPQTPNASGLGKFGNIPVSLYTGVPSISIPIFEINVSGITLPITLNYHSAGFRVNEVASNVGLGWSLSADPQVSRNVVGLPDESSFGFFDGPALTNDPTTINEHSQKYYEARRGARDIEPDQYSYNLAGSSGKFVCKKDKSIFEIPLSDNKITRLPNGFAITTPQGISYSLDQGDRASQYSYGPGYDKQGPLYTSNWHTSKITSANGVDEVIFSYTQDCNESFYYTTNYSTTIGVIPKENYGETPTYGFDITSSMDRFNFRALNVSSITFKTGKVDFIYDCDRLDLTSAVRLKEVLVYQKTQTGYSLLKRVVLSHSYFYYNPIPSAPTSLFYINHRLRLDQVTIYGSDQTTPPQAYTLTYDNTPMAPVNNNGQDRWGFNNGNFSNSTLIPVTKTVLGGRFYQFGNAYRSSNETYMKACIIKEIKYPTGGKTVFDFEPHQFEMEESKVEPISYSVNSTGTNPGPNLSVTSFTVPIDEPYARNATLAYYLSRYDVNGIIDRPSIKIEDETTGEITSIGHPNAGESVSTSPGPMLWPLVPGHSYKLSASVPAGAGYPNTYTVNVRATIEYVRDTKQKDIRSEGGLRIKTITNYGNKGEFINKELYKYGQNENGLGELLTPSKAIYINYNDVKYRTGYTNVEAGVWCAYNTSNSPARDYESFNQIPVSQISGSPVVYGYVTKYQVSEDDTPNGKQRSIFLVETDGAFSIPQEFNALGQFFTSNPWRSGLLAYESNHKFENGSYKLISSLFNTYSEERKTSFSNIKFQLKYNHSGCLMEGPTYIQTDFIFFDYAIRSGYMFLKSTEKKTIDNQGNEVAIVENYGYQNVSHLNLTQKTSTTSKQQTIVETYLYPHDKAATEAVYQKMVNRNMTGLIVEASKTTNGNLLNRTRINFTDWFSNSKILLPSLVEQQIGTGPLEAKIHFNGYDMHGNLLEQAKDKDISSVYLWSYNNTYPVAEIKNATYQQVRDALGGQNKVNEIAAADNVENYLNQLNQLRQLLPDAMVSTYTYLPLIGLKTLTGPDDKKLTYEYDTFQRLRLIKDHKNQIVKQYRYHYQGQPALE